MSQDKSECLTLNKDFGNKTREHKCKKKEGLWSNYKM